MKDKTIVITDKKALDKKGNNNFLNNMKAPEKSKNGTVEIRKIKRFNLKNYYKDVATITRINYVPKKSEVNNGKK